MKAASRPGGARTAPSPLPPPPPPPPLPPPPQPDAHLGHLGEVPPRRDDREQGPALRQRGLRFLDQRRPHPANEYRDRPEGEADLPLRRKPHRPNVERDAP